MNKKSAAVITTAAGTVALVALGLALLVVGQFMAIASDACMSRTDESCGGRINQGVALAALPQLPLAFFASGFSAARVAGGVGRAVRPLLWGLGAMVACSGAGLLLVYLASS